MAGGLRPPRPPRRARLVECNTGKWRPNRTKTFPMSFVVLLMTPHAFGVHLVTFRNFRFFFHFFSKNSLKGTPWDTTSGVLRYFLNFFDHFLIDFSIIFSTPGGRISVTKIFPRLRKVLNRRRILCSFKRAHSLCPIILTSEGIFYFPKFPGKCHIL